MSFCKRVNPNETPFYVQVAAEDYAKHSLCNKNVEAKIARDGGDAIHGWIIWFGDDLVEAEFHWIWRSPTGDLVDISPKPDGETSILFLPHPNLWDGVHYINNRRQAIRDTAATRAMVRSFEYLEAEKAKIWVPDRFDIPPEVKEEFVRIQTAIGLGVGIGRNDPCPCKSGKKFKKCCGAPTGAPYTNF